MIPTKLFISMMALLIMGLVACGPQEKSSLQTVQRVLPPQNKIQFCQMARESRSSQYLADHLMSRVAFSNYGGLMNGGVCWWHSRFQRAALYLAIFRADLPRPTEAEARHLVYNLVNARQVTEIPGYANLYEFTRDWEYVIQPILEQWQRTDGFKRFAWIKGLSGKTKETPQNMKAIVEQIFDRVMNRHEVVYLKLQTPGIDSHSWLVYDMEKNYDGYTVTYIDSNFPASRTVYRYRNGDESFYISAYGNFVPYIEKSGVLAQYKSLSKKYCR